MTIKVNIQGDKGNFAGVSTGGELIVRPFFEYSKAFRKVLNAVDTAFNLVVPQPFKSFIVTGLIINADKNVTGSAVVQIYPADSPTSRTALADGVVIDLPKNETVTIVPLPLKIDQGQWINAETDDATINISLLGYFLPD